MRARHPLFYMFSRGLWKKNANPVTSPRQAAMMSGQEIRKNSRQVAKTPRPESEFQNF